MRRIWANLARRLGSRRSRSRAGREQDADGDLVRLALDEMDANFALFAPDRTLVSHTASYAALHAEAFATLPRPLRYDDLMRLAIVGTEGVADPEAELARRIAAHEGEGSAFDRLYPGGRWMRVLKRRLPTGHVAGLALDITELKAREAEAAAGEARYRALVDTAPVGLWQLDEGGRTLFHNARLAALFGGVVPADLEAAQLRRAGEASPATGPFGFPPGREVEISISPGPGRREVHLLVAASAWLPATETLPRSAVLTVLDMTPLKAAQARAEHLAWHDTLTGLPNRARFAEALAEAAARAEGALLLLDLDRFKAVNDTWGHGAGDALLRSAAERMRATLRRTETVFRLGGDEFAVVVPGPVREAEVGRIAARLGEAMARPFDLDGAGRAEVGASIGAVLLGPSGEGEAATAEEAAERADLALYAAKEAGRGTHRFFLPAMEREARERRGLGEDLRAALVGPLDAAGLDLHYQPIIEIATGRVSGCEALLRWHHPARGEVSPSLFVPLAEELGLIAPLGTWVLRRACRDAAGRGWPEGMRVAVNVSPVQLRGDAARDFAVEVARTLAATGLDAGRLELEVTETALLEEAGGTAGEALAALRATGVRVALDDFGTGHSSLERLCDLPVDRLKVDRRFLAAHGQGGGDGAIPKGRAAVVRAVAALARETGLQVTAEGVETEAALAFVRACGVEEVQGHLFHRAMPARDIGALLGPRALRVPDAA